MVFSCNTRRVKTHKKISSTHDPDIAFQTNYKIMARVSHLQNLTLILKPMMQDRLDKYPLYYKNLLHTRK